MKDNQQMILQHYRQVPFFQFADLARFSGIVHGVFTRRGGVSRSPFDSLNVSLRAGDDEACVLRNRAIVAECMRADDLVFINQVHEADVIVFKRDDPLNDAGTSGGAVTGDAMISNVPGKMLCIQAADCQPVLLHDPVAQAVANIHSGWRGSIQNIIGRTIRSMEENFGCKPSDIVAGIGPSLGPCCAEFIHYRTELPKSFWKFKNDSQCFDFWAASRHQLEAAGIRSGNIATSTICTRCRTDLFFSYRAEKRTGRFAAVIGCR